MLRSDSRVSGRTPDLRSPESEDASLRGSGGLSSNAPGSRSTLPAPSAPERLVSRSNAAVHAARTTSSDLASLNVELPEQWLEPSDEPDAWLPPLPSAANRVRAARRNPVAQPRAAKQQPAPSWRPHDWQQAEPVEQSWRAQEWQAAHGYDQAPQQHTAPEPASRQSWPNQPQLRAQIAAAAARLQAPQQWPEERTERRGYTAHDAATDLYAQLSEQTVAPVEEEQYADPDSELEYEPLPEEEWQVAQTSEAVGPNASLEQAWDAAYTEPSELDWQLQDEQDEPAEEQQPQQYAWQQQQDYASRDYASQVEAIGYAEQPEPEPQSQVWQVQPEPVHAEQYEQTPVDSWRRNASQVLEARPTTMRQPKRRTSWAVPALAVVAAAIVLGYGAARLQTWRERQASQLTAAVEERAPQPATAPQASAAVVEPVATDLNAATAQPAAEQTEPVAAARSGRTHHWRRGASTAEPESATPEHAPPRAEAVAEQATQQEPPPAAAAAPPPPTAAAAPPESESPALAAPSVQPPAAVLPPAAASPVPDALDRAVQAPAAKSNDAALAMVDEVTGSPEPQSPKAAPPPLAAATDKAHAGPPPVLTVRPLAETGSEEGAGPAKAEQPSREQVRDAMLAMQPQLAACAGNRHGTSYANVTIQGNGTVSYSLIDGAFAGTEAGSCMARALRATTFPTFFGPPFKVRYPLVF